MMNWLLLSDWSAKEMTFELGQLRLVMGLLEVGVKRKSDCIEFDVLRESVTKNCCCRLAYRVMRLLGILTGCNASD
jgi:hypothetical protein